MYFDLCGMLFNFTVISEAQNLANKPPLQLVISQTIECMKLMSKNGIASSAFASMSDYLH